MSEAEEWVVLELLGHVKLAGKVTEEERFGLKIGRIDVPQEDGSFVTRYFGGNSIYGMTPVTEQVARQVAKGLHRVRSQPWDYPRRITDEQPREPVFSQRREDHEDEDDEFDDQGEKVDLPF